MSAFSATRRVLHRVRCVVFDVDDTLYLERDYVRSGFDAVGAACGVPGFAGACWDLFCEGVRGHTFDRALSSLGVEPSPDLVGRLVDAYRSHRPVIELSPDALAVLGTLSGLELACVTDGDMASQSAKVDALGLGRWLSPIVITAGLGPGRAKPHPAAFREVERASGRPGPAHVYVADNPVKDFEAPKHLGWSTVRIRRPGSLWEQLGSGEDVDVEVTTLTELVPLLDPGAVGDGSGADDHIAGRRR